MTCLHHTVRHTALLGIAAATLGNALPASSQTPAAGAVRRPLSPVDDSMPAFPVLTLEEVVRRALDASPTMAVGTGDVRIARSTERVALGAYLPTLTLTSAATRTDAASTATTGVGTTGQNTLNNQTLGVAAAVDVFTGGRRQADDAFARAELVAARSTLVLDRYTVALTAQQAFYEVIRATELAGVARFALTEAQRLLRYTLDMSRAGTAMRSDVLRAQLQVTTTREQLVAANDTLLTGAYALGWLTGADGPAGAKVDSTSDCIRPLALEDSAIMRLAAGAAPTVTAAEAMATADRAALRAARTQYIPTLTATGGYNWATNSTVATAGTRPGWTIAIGTSYPIFNGFQREDAIVRARVTSDIGRAVASDAHRAARARAAQLLTSLRTAETGIVLGGEAVGSASEDLRVQMERYRAGVSTMLDVLTSETALVQARYSLVIARHSYNITRASLEALVGRQL
jgi:outer membrane protein TolC